MGLIYIQVLVHWKMWQIYAGRMEVLKELLFILMRTCSGNQQAVDEALPKKQSSGFLCLGLPSFRADLREKIRFVDYECTLYSDINGCSKQRGSFPRQQFYANYHLAGAYRQICCNVYCTESLEYQL